MRVSNIRIVATDATCELQGQVESNRDPYDDDWFEPFTLWFRFPRRYHRSLVDHPTQVVIGSF